MGPHHLMMQDGLHGGESNLYDTCESKSRAKTGDVEWKAKADGLLTASEAKQIWLEREIQTLKSALDRVSIPTAFHESGYWNGGFERAVPPVHYVHSATSERPLDGAVPALCGERGVEDLRHRASACAPNVPGGIRAAYMHGEHLPRDRAQHMHGVPLCDSRAPPLHGLHSGDGRAWPRSGFAW